LFNKDGIDPGGGRTNNAWIIRTFSYLEIVLKQTHLLLETSCHNFFNLLLLSRKWAAKRFKLQVKYHNKMPGV